MIQHGPRPGMEHSHQSRLGAQPLDASGRRIEQQSVISRAKTRLNTAVLRTARRRSDKVDRPIRRKAVNKARKSRFELIEMPLKYLLVFRLRASLHHVSTPVRMSIEMRILCQWTYTPNTDPLSEADVIVGMAFGANIKGKGQPPGASNEEIARIILRLWTTKHMPVFVQREVAEAITKLNIPIQPVLVISEDDRQFHITSYEVLARTYQLCKRLNLRRAVLVAHPAHIQRCAWVAEKIGFIVTLPDVSSVPYEPGSSQWWTRDRFSFLIWDLCARVGWRLKGYL